MLARTLDALVGGARTHPLEARLFNTISLLNGVTNLGGAVVLVAGGGSRFVVVLQVVTGALFLVCYALSLRFGVSRALYWPFVLLILGFLAANALGNAGTLGGAHYYLVPALVIATILARSVPRTLVAALLFAGATVALFVVEARRPDLVTPYAEPGERALDAGANLVFVELFASALVLILSRNLEQERRKSDALLRNILPERVADELKRDERVRPRAYESATVLFTDCVGFTRIAEGLTAEGLVAELDELFTRFDAVARERGLEKIKTIGDAYMAVGGVPEANRTHAVDCVLAALAFCDAAHELRREREAAGRPAFEIRVGAHTGPLVAGVIGRAKFAYDVWGDTVNTASRMESAGAPGRVNVSEATWERVAPFFVGEPRGRVAAKGKGELAMVFVEGVRPELSENGDGRTPNARFRELRAALDREDGPAPRGRTVSLRLPTP